MRCITPYRKANERRGQTRRSENRKEKKGRKTSLHVFVLEPSSFESVLRNATNGQMTLVSGPREVDAKCSCRRECTLVFCHPIYYYRDHVTPSPSMPAPFPLPGMASSYEKRSKLPPGEMRGMYPIGPQFLRERRDSCLVTLPPTQPPPPKKDPDDDQNSSHLELLPRYPVFWDIFMRVLG